jgi:hypothetical protein
VETRAIDATTALLVATAALCCSVVVGCAFVLVFAAGTKDLPGGHEPAALCAAAALACASVAALIALTREAGGLRPGALAGAWVLAFAWPLSGAPVPAAAVATVATGLAVRWGADGARGRGGAVAAALLAAAALGLMTIAIAAAPDEGASYGPPAEARASAADERVPLAAAQRRPSTASEDAPSNAAAGDAPSNAADEETPSAAAGDARSSAADEETPSAAADEETPSAAADEETPSAAADEALSAARAVRAYYRALDRRDFGDAWRGLSPGIHASFGGFERWRAGFATTLSSTPSALRATVAGDGAAVAHVLTARDSADCGVLVRQFSVQWRLRRTPNGWRAVALTAQPSDAPSRCAA